MGKGRHPVRRICVFAALISVALASTGARAERWDSPGALELPRAEPPGFLLGDDWRYTDRDFRFHLLTLDVFKRLGADLLAIPAAFFTTWQRADYAALIGWGAPTLAFMVGPVPLDSRLQFWVHDTFGRAGQRFTVWTKLGDVVFWAAVWAASVSTLLAGWFGPEKRLVEMFALMMEAFGLGQFWELVPKLLLGREGPMNGEGLGVVYGPSRALALFPAGTPSGHASTFYAMMGVVSAYWENPWLTAALHAVGLLFCATMLVDDYHFVSDIVWGAAMGWELGAWVVRHRSTRYRYEAGRPVRVVPVIEPRSGTVAVSLAFGF